MALQCQSSFIKFPCLLCFWRYFIKTGSFSVFNFFSTTSSSYWVTFPNLISNCLLIIYMIGLSVTLGEFPSKFLKYSFYVCIRFSWLAAFNLALGMFFLLLTSFTIYHAIRDYLFSAKSLILSIWPWIYSICSFWYALISSLCAFLSFWASALVKYLL